jgi:hypothetical protein
MSVSTASGEWDKVIAKISLLFIHHSIGLRLTALIIVRAIVKLAVFADTRVFAALAASVLSSVVQRSQATTATPAIATFV